VCEVLFFFCGTTPLREAAAFLLLQQAAIFPELGGVFFFRRLADDTRLFWSSLRGTFPLPNLSWVHRYLFPLFLCFFYRQPTSFFFAKFKQAMTSFVRPQTAPTFDSSRSPRLRPLFLPPIKLPFFFGGGSSPEWLVPPFRQLTPARALNCLFSVSLVTGETPSDTSRTYFSR